MSTPVLCHPDETVAAIRKRAAAGESIDDLSAEFGVSKYTITGWLRGARRGPCQKKYKYLPDARVRELRVRASQGEPISVLCRELGISITSGTKLVNGRRRREAGGPLRHEWPPLVRRRSACANAWTEEQDEWARSLPLKEVAELTGKSVEAVRLRRFRLGLRPNKREGERRAGQ